MKLFVIVASDSIAPSRMNVRAKLTSATAKTANIGIVTLSLLSSVLKFSIPSNSPTFVSFLKNLGAKPRTDNFCNKRERLNTISMSVLNNATLDNPFTASNTTLLFGSIFPRALAIGLTLFAELLIPSNEITDMAIIAYKLVDVPMAA